MNDIKIKDLSILQDELSDLKIKYEKLLSEHTRLKTDFYMIKSEFEKISSEAKKSVVISSEDVIQQELIEKILKHIKEKDVYLNSLSDYQKSEIAYKTMPFAKKMVDSFGSFHPNLHRSILNCCGNPPSEIAYITKMYEILSGTMIKTYHIAEVIKKFDEKILISLYVDTMFDSWERI